MRVGKVVEAAGAWSLEVVGANSRADSVVRVTGNGSFSFFESGVGGTTLMPPTRSGSFSSGGGGGGGVIAGWDLLKSIAKGLPVCVDVTGLSVAGAVTGMVGSVHKADDFVLLSFSLK